MKAAWYERNGPAREVLVVGEQPDPKPGPGQVRVRIEVAGVNPADVKRRSGVGGREMTVPRIVPGDDGAGVIDEAGAGVPRARIDERVWVHSACQQEPFGTAAESVVVRAAQATKLPANTSFEVGACLGVPALTAHRCLFADGPLHGLTVLVTGGAGAVGHHAIQLAKQGGARTDIATASSREKLQAASEAGADYVISYREPDAARKILDLVGPNGIDRVIDVAFGANLPLTSAVIARNGVIASYASDAVPEPCVPFYTLMRRGVTIRTVLVFVMPPPAIESAIDTITKLLTEQALTHPIAARYPLEEIAAAHERLERGEAIGKVLICRSSAGRRTAARGAGRLEPYASPSEPASMPP